MNTSRKIGSVAIFVVTAVTATIALGASDVHTNDRPHEHMGKMMRGGGMMGMMHGKGRMMDMMASCPMMRRNNSSDGDTGRPNSQWREKATDHDKKGG